MKKNVLVFGLLYGLIVTAFMIYSSVNCYYNANFKSNEVVGYAGMLIAASFIYIGIKNYRDKFNNGTITFGKAFKVGLLITLVASTFYVLVWVIEYYVFLPDWMDKYCTHLITEAKATGANQVKMEKTNELVDTYKKIYSNPFYVVLATFVEVLPIGVIVSLICALILKRKSNTGRLATAMAS
jgi:hypothetical protein